MMWTHARTLRIADGPDEVHEMVLARRELARHRDARSARG
jgi:acyl-CoA dehydrogenase